MKKRWRHSLPNVRFARYADDWCVFLTRCNRQYAERLRDEIRDFLRETCGLELSAEKTRITHMRDGYDFLGFNISVGVGKSGEVVPKVRVGRKAITNIQRRLEEAIRYRPTQESISVRLVRGSAVIRGWSNYFKIAHNFSQVANGLDYKAFWIAVKAICRKADISTAKCLRRHRLREHHRRSRRLYPGSLRRIRCRRITMRRRNRINLATASISGRRRMGGGFRPPRTSRPGCGDLKWKALVRDGFHCRGCGVTVTSKTSQADHTVPVNRFANLEMANSLDNIKTLCLRCHKLKTARETMCLESSGKPDAWKLARPVWGWGRGEIPRPTPHEFAAKYRRRHQQRRVG